jgi:hypothetical protein
MLLVLVGILLAVWVLYSGWRFYSRVNWEEPPDPSPDLQGMRKREAELLHIQDVLLKARQEGKLSAQVIDEFNRYLELETQAIRNVETAWKNRKILASRHSRESGNPEA